MTAQCGVVVEWKEGGRMRRYSFDGGPEVNQDSGEWVKYADVQAWLEKNAQAYQHEGKYERAAAVFALLDVLGYAAAEMLRQRIGKEMG